MKEALNKNDAFELPSFDLCVETKQIERKMMMMMMMVMIMSYIPALRR
jgi:hypothetical protein